MPDHVEYPPILYRSATTSVDLPHPSRSALTMLRSEAEILSGRRLPLAEVLGRMVDFASENRMDFLRFCTEP